MVIRDFRGKVIDACSKYLVGLFSVMEVELLAVEIGILLAKELKIPNIEGNFTEIPSCEKQKKIKKTHAKENNHTYKTIFTWFGNLPTSTELQGFHYYQRKIQSAAIDILTLKNTATSPLKP